MATRKKLQLPIAAVDFTEPSPSIAKIFNKENRVYATRDEFFVKKFRDIFPQTRLKHTTSAELKTWLRSANMKYWPRQLNFAVFCATPGCGISREIFVVFSNTTDKGILPVSRVFHDQADFVPARRYPEHERSAWRPNF